MHNNPAVYPSILSAAQGLLGEAVTIVRGANLPFAVVGGWAPYLRNATPIAHPGTKDVDLLFEKGAQSGALQDVVRRFISNGYIPSAKHEFQILRELNVSGSAFMFNVDLLHPEEESKNPDLFVDHLQLPVPSREYCSDRYFVKSIMIPKASFIFDGHFSHSQVQCELPSGRTCTVEVPLISETAVIITKAGSCKSPKRQRDAFDIFVTIAQSVDYHSLVNSFLCLKRDNRDVYNTVYAIKKAVASNSFVENSCRYLPASSIDFRAGVNGSLSSFEECGRQAASVRDCMNKFFDDIELDEKASSTD